MGRLTSVFGSKNVDHILGRPHILGEGKDALRHSRLAKKRPHFLTSPSAINLLWRHNVRVLYTPPRGLSRGPLSLSSQTSAFPVIPELLRDSGIEQWG